MTPETARKIVVAMAFVGGAAVVWQGQKAGDSAAKTYRRVWGLMLLTAGGAVLADFVPQIVGPYMALVLLGFLLSNKNGLGSLFKSAGSAASSSASGASTSTA
jgi:hypothetical protein